MKLKALENTVVHCKTPEDNMRFLEVLKDNGWKRADYWSEYKESTCYSVETFGRQTYGYTEYYGEEGYRIISLSEFLQEQSEDLKPGDWCEVTETFTESGQQFTCGDRYQVSDYLASVMSAYPFALDVSRREGLWGCHQATEKCKRSWLIQKENLHKIKKCSPPEEKTYAPQRQYIAFNNVPHDEFNISSPSPLMDTVKSAVSYLREKALPKSEKTLRKAGFKDSYSNWTSQAKDAVLEQLCEERSKELIALAEELIKDAEKDCCK